MHTCERNRRVACRQFDINWEKEIKKFKIHMTCWKTLHYSSCMHEWANEMNESVRGRRSTRGKCVNSAEFHSNLLFRYYFASHLSLFAIPPSTHTALFLSFRFVAAGWWGWKKEIPKRRKILMFERVEWVQECEQINQKPGTFLLLMLALSCELMRF